MISIDTLAEFFGWCTVINIGIYLLSVGGLALFRNLAYRMIAGIFAIGEAEVARSSLQYVGNYKLALITLSFVPYVALKIMS